MACKHDHCGKCCASGCFGYPDVAGCLTDEEREILSLFSSVPFLPVAKDGEKIIFLEDKHFPQEVVGKIILSLERKGALQVDYDIPLGGFDYKGYGESLHGSLALTPLGQEMLEQINI